MLEVPWKREGKQRHGFATKGADWPCAFPVSLPPSHPVVLTGGFVSFL